MSWERHGNTQPEFAKLELLRCPSKPSTSDLYMNHFDDKKPKKIFKAVTSLHGRRHISSANPNNYSCPVLTNTVDNKDVLFKDDRLRNTLNRATAKANNNASCVYSAVQTCSKVQQHVNRQQEELMKLFEEALRSGFVRVTSPPPHQRPQHIWSRFLRCISCNSTWISYLPCMPRYSANHIRMKLSSPLQ